MRVRWNRFAGAAMMAIGMATCLLAACTSAPEKPQAATTQPAPVQPEPKPEANSEAPHYREMKTYRSVVEMSLPTGEKTRLEYLVDRERLNLKFSVQEAGQWKTMSHFLKDGTALYVVNPEQKTAIKIPPVLKRDLEAIPAEMIFVPDWAAFLKERVFESVKSLGIVEVNGQEYLAYDVREKGKPELMKIYVDQKNLIRKIELYQEGKPGPHTLDVIEVDLSPSVTDADFQPPADYQVQELPGLPGLPGSR